MECFIAVVIFGLIAVAASGIGLGLSPHTSGRAYQALTRRFGGTFQRGNTFKRPSTRFRYGPTWVTITPGPKRGQSRTTQAILQWPDNLTSVDIDTKSSFRPTNSNLASPNIDVADAEFSRHYQVTGQNREAVVKLLSDGVRWQINKLCQFFDCPFIHISIHAGRMTVEKPAILRRNEDLEQFTQLCLELFDQAMLTKSEGIEFLGASDEAQTIEDPICQVCGEEITSEMVFCRRCRTPHHLDCWLYTGQCSIYGCREKQYAIPAVARPVTPTDDDNPTADDA